MPMFSARSRDYEQKTGALAIGSIILAILSAGRNSLSFFLLLIVSLGYGVVR